MFLCISDIKHNIEDHCPQWAESQPAPSKPFIARPQANFRKTGEKKKIHIKWKGN